MGISTIFLKIVVDGNAIEGECASLGYEGQIEVESFSWQTEAKLTVNASTSSGYTAKLEQKHLKLTKVFDKASGNLYRVAGQEPPRKKFSTALLTMVTMSVEGGGKNNKILEVLLSDGHIEEVNLNASESGKTVGLRETVTLSFTKSELRYFPLNYITGARARTAPMTFAHDFSPVK